MYLNTYLEIDGTGYDLEVDDVWYVPGMPSCTCELPENCYPAEDEQLEYTVLSVTYFTDDGDEHLLIGERAEQFAEDNEAAIAAAVVKEVLSYA